MTKKTHKTKFQFKEKHVFIIIALLSFVLYGKSISNNYNIDDNYVIENHKLATQGIKAIPEIFTSRYHDQEGLYFGYRPLTIAVFAIEWDIFVNAIGVKSASFPNIAHFFNIIYYIVFCCLLFKTIKYLFEKKWYATQLAIISTLIFLVHPIHTEVVLSLKNREEILSGLLGILAIYQSFKYFDTQKIWRLIVAILSLALGFLAKESAIVFLIIIPIAYFFFKTEVKVLKWFEFKNRASLIILTLWLIALIGIVSIDTFKFFLLKFTINPTPIISKVWRIIALIYIVINLISGLLAKKYKELKLFIPKMKNIRTLILFTLMLFSIIANSGHLLFLLLMIYNIFLTLNLKSKNYTSEEFETSQKHKSVLENLKTLPKPLLISAIGLIIATATIGIIYFVQTKALPEINAPVFKWQNPAFDFNKSTSELLAIGFFTIGYYIKLLFIPYPLRFYYGYKVIPDLQITDLSVIISIIIVLCIVIFSIIGFNRRKAYGFGLLIFLIAILPFANFIFPLTGVVAERLLFIPSIGFSIIAAYLILLLTKSLSDDYKTQTNKYKPIFISIILCIPFSIITINRNADWKDRISLYKADIPHLEKSAKANNLYANYLIGEVYTRIQHNVSITPVVDNIQLAEKHYKQAINVDSSYANPYHNLGYIYLILHKDYKTALPYFEKAISLDSTIHEAYLNKGITNYYSNNFDEAIESFKKYESISSKPSDKAYYYLAKSYFEIGNSELTEYYFLKLIEIEIDLKSINEEIFNYFYEKEKFEKAILVAENIHKLEPKSDKPFIDIGNCYLLIGDTIQAIENWEIAFEKFNGNFNIGMTLVGYFNEQQNPEKANYYYQKAIAYRQMHGIN